jgi:hypothetical protein
MSALTTQVQGLGCRIASLQGLRDWIRWLYWQDVLNPVAQLRCSTPLLNPVLNPVAQLVLNGLSDASSAALPSSSSEGTSASVGFRWPLVASVVALDAFLMYPSTYPRCHIAACMYPECRSRMYALH